MNEETCIRSTPLAKLIEAMPEQDLIALIKGNSMDPTENVRREMVAQQNSNPEIRTELEDKYGKNNVWNTTELQETFRVEGFMAPFAIVRRKSDNQKGTVRFQHDPRFYFDFQE